jgi:hypothetical protein
VSEIADTVAFVSTVHLNIFTKSMFVLTTVLLRAFWFSFFQSTDIASPYVLCVFIECLIGNHSLRRLTASSTNSDLETFYHPICCAYLPKFPSAIRAAISSSRRQRTTVTSPASVFGNMYAMPSNVR